MAEALGVERADGDPLKTNPSAILGTNEITPLGMAGAYATIAAGGRYCEPIVVDRAVGPDGTELAGQPQVCRQAISAAVANTAAYALQGVMTGGTGSASNPGDGIPILGKTGTTNNAEHTWIVTSTTRVATAVWVGNSIGLDPLYNYSYAGYAGNQLRHPVMNGTMSWINAKYGGAEFPGPDQGMLGGSSLQVPDLRGQTPEAAKALLEGIGFGYLDGGAIDSEVEAGKVAGTNPAAGENSAFGIIITVYTSKGNKKAFPDVVGDGKTYTFDDAVALLNDQGYDNIDEECVALPTGATATDSRIDKVKASDPSPGDLVVPGVNVTLTVQKLTC
jgi:membrane peptidoglycan carboxypeptidase